MDKSLNTPGVIPQASRKIRWLASYPKSGNTWVRMFLNAYCTGFPIGLNVAHQYVTSDLRPELYQMMMPRPLTEMTVAEQLMYHPGALINAIKLANTKDTVLKTHNAKAICEGTVMIPPSISAPSIYIIRDPRDVVISQAAHFKLSIGQSIEALAKSDRCASNEFNLSHVFMDWSSHVKSWTRENKDVDVLIVKYEDLFNPESFKAIIKQLELEFDQSRFDFALKESSFESLRANEAKNGFNEKRGGEMFFREGKPKQYKMLTSAERARIEQRHKEMMEYYGYL
jgi:hypothetical protein